PKTGGIALADVQLLPVSRGGRCDLDCVGPAPALPLPPDTSLAGSWRSVVDEPDLLEPVLVLRRGDDVADSAILPRHARSRRQGDIEAVDAGGTGDIVRMAIALADQRHRGGARLQPAAGVGKHVEWVAA